MIIKVVLFLSALETLTIYMYILAWLLTTYNTSCHIQLHVTSSRMVQSTVWLIVQVTYDGGPRLRPRASVLERVTQEAAAGNDEVLSILVTKCRSYTRWPWTMLLMMTLTTRPQIATTNLRSTWVFNDSNIAILETAHNDVSPNKSF